MVLQWGGPLVDNLRKAMHQEMKVKHRVILLIVSLVVISFLYLIILITTLVLDISDEKKAEYTLLIDACEGDTVNENKKFMKGYAFNAISFVTLLFCVPF